MPTTDELKSSPDALLGQFLSIAREHSALSESTVRKDFPCDDGYLVVSSHQGGEIEYAVEPLQTYTDADGEEVVNREPHEQYAAELAAHEAAQE